MAGQARQRTAYLLSAIHRRSVWAEKLGMENSQYQQPCHLEEDASGCIFELQITGIVNIIRCDETISQITALLDTFLDTILCLEGFHGKHFAGNYHITNVTADPRHHGPTSSTQSSASHSNETTPYIPIYVVGFISIYLSLTVSI